MRNPFTGEDYRRWRQKGPLPNHALWVTTKKPASKFHFLAVVHPGGPEQAGHRTGDHRNQNYLDHGQDGSSMRAGR